MIPDIWVTSDQHFGHANVLEFLDSNGRRIRPEFSSVEEMDEFMVDSWNSAVGPSDLVYCLGDIRFGSRPSACLDRLAGRKRLILGNHDLGKDQQLQRVFQKIMLWRMFPELECVLTHVPLVIPEFAKYRFNVHGHVHQNRGPSPFHINACVEVTNYRPVLLEQLIARRLDRLAELEELQNRT